MSKQKGSRNEIIVANFFGIKKDRTMASGAAVGDSDIVSNNLGLVFEVKAGKEGKYLPALVFKAMRQAEATAEKYNLEGISVFVPDGVGEVTFPDKGLVLMRPSTLKNLLEGNVNTKIEDLTIKIGNKTFKCVD